MQRESSGGKADCGRSQNPVGHEQDLFMAQATHDVRHSNS
jgi:hypothetical protein